MTGNHAPIPTRALVADPVLAEQIRQCELMLSDTIPWMRANPERVDFDELMTKCGTYGCLAGWHGFIAGVDIMEAEWSELIGGDSYLTNSIFGHEEVGTLDDREARLRAHLATLYARAGISA